MKLINFFGGPGITKSTTAAEVFAKFKRRGVKCELVREYAKELTYRIGRGDHQAAALLADQEHVFAVQHERVTMLEGQVDYAITDSPVLLGLVYVRPEQDTLDFRRRVRSAFHQYESYNYRLERKSVYQTYGRTQTEAEARAIDERFGDLLRPYLYTTLPGDNHAADYVVHDVLARNNALLSVNLSSPEELQDARTP